MTRIVAGMRTGQYTPEEVLRLTGLDSRITAEQLVEAAKAFDEVNPGYISKKEMYVAADGLRQTNTSTKTTIDGYRCARRTLANVKDEYLRGDPSRTYTNAELVGAAARWDDGNAYLKRPELEAGAIELQISANRPLTAADVAAIMSWTGASRSQPVPEQQTYRELGDLSPTEAAAVVSVHVPALAIDDLVAEGQEVMDNRDGTTITPVRVTGFERDQQGKMTVTVGGSFDYEDCEFDWYGVFSVANNGDYNLIDAGAD